MSQVRSGKASPQQSEVWVTGLGLVSSLGEGPDAHWAALADNNRPTVDEQQFSPYPIHPLGEIDYASQIDRKGDLRQMGSWQRIGVYAAGLALEDAQVAHKPDFLAKTNLVVAAGNGERDETADAAVLKAIKAMQNGGRAPDATLSQILQTSLRPTLYLSELSNLLAGNISIVHGVAGSSRTYKGEEMAGVSAIEDAVRRISARQGELFLAGGAFNSERADLLLVYELCRALWSRPFKSVWERETGGGGFVMGSLGAFLVLESETHARARGKRPYAKITSINSRCSTTTCKTNGVTNGAKHAIAALPADLTGPLGILSGASGTQSATADELKWIDGLRNYGIAPAVRAYGTMMGHSVEAHFPAGVALAALAVSRRAFFAPFDDTGRESELPGTLERTVVTGWGHWRGAGFALVETANIQ